MVPIAEYRPFESRRFEPLKCPVLGAELTKIRIGDPSRAIGLHQILACDGHEALAAGYRKRLEQNRIHQRKDCGVDPDAERKCDDYRSGEIGRASYRER